MIDIEENQLKIAAFINRYKSQSATLMEQTYIEALQKLTAMIVETSNKSEKARRIALQKQIIDILNRGYNKLNPLVLDDMRAVAQYSYTNTMLAMSTHGGAVLAFTDLPDKAVSKMLDMRSLIQLGDSGVTMQDMINSNKIADINAFKQTIGSGIASGQTSEQIAKELKDIINRRKKKILTVTRTVIAEASSRASMESYDQNDDVVIGWQYNATLDRNTTPYCAGNDGRQLLKSRGWTREVGAK